MTIWVAYFSPAGTTRQVAGVIAQEVEGLGETVHLQDLAGPRAGAGPIYEDLSPGDVLFVGSPVYAHHPVPHVTEFLSELPNTPGSFAAPFVTYGLVTSGRALHDMAKIMESKDLKILGGIKVLAVHSSHWQSDDPVGKGHPDAEDAARIKEFVRLVFKKKESERVETLDLEALAYNEEMPEEPSGQSRLEVIKSMTLPLELDTETCTQCGICVDSCPVANIVLSPYPAFSDRCILCFNCIRYCETNAVSSRTLPMIDSFIRERLKSFNEPQETRIFV
jgi:ferredoxin/flavodoxin